MSNKPKGGRVRVTFRDEFREPHELRLSAFAQIAAKRRYGMDVLQSGDPEPGLFGAFVDIVGPAAAKSDPEAFDRWLSEEVLSFEAIDEDEDAEDPTPAEPERSSPDSPPTSE